MNLAGSAYEENTPYSASEPFFYLVGFTDDNGTGDYGDYDLVDNSITLTDGQGNYFDTILEKTVLPHMPNG